MGNRHGGKKVKIAFGSNEKGELRFQVLELAYPHSREAKLCKGCGEWVLWEQKCFHRPAQAFTELFFALRDLELIDNTAGALAAAEYWVKDMDETRVDRLKLAEEYKKKLLAVKQ